MARTVDAVGAATPETGVKDILTQGVLGGVPKQQLPGFMKGSAVQVSLSSVLSNAVAAANNHANES